MDGCWNDVYFPTVQNAASCTLQDQTVMPPQSDFSSSMSDICIMDVRPERALSDPYNTTGITRHPTSHSRSTPVRRRGRDQTWLAPRSTCIAALRGLTGQERTQQAYCRFYDRWIVTFLALSLWDPINSSITVETGIGMVSEFAVGTSADMLCICSLVAAYHPLWYHTELPSPQYSDTGSTIALLTCTFRCFSTVFNWCGL